MKKVSARTLAARCLLEVEQGAFSNLVFKQITEKIEMDARDIQFFARLFYGTIERTVTLDYILSRYLKGGIEKLDIEILAILRSGLYQCLYMDAVPVSAAVNESVKLCKVFKKKSAAGLVNAVLRRAADFDFAEIYNIDNTVERVSAQYSVCPALAQLLLGQYGYEAEDILAATLRRMPAAVRVNTLSTGTEELIKRLAAEDITAVPSWLDGALEITAGRYPASGAISDGSMRVQSLAAQYVVHVMAPKAGDSILDACAAPGGKALTAAQMMKNSGRIIAMDIYENRLKLIEEQAAKEGVQIIKTVCADAAEYSGETLYDAALCDVPCSGFGEMAAKPELRRKEPTGSALCALQLKILQNAAKLVAKNGHVVYSTCTLDKTENEDVVSEFLAKNGNYKATMPKNAPGYARIAGDGVKFVPDGDNNEGFFIATLERMW